MLPKALVDKIMVNSRSKLLCAVCANILRNKMFGLAENTPPTKLVELDKVEEIERIRSRR